MIRKFHQWYENGHLFRLIHQHGVHNNLKEPIRAWVSVQPMRVQDFCNGVKTYLSSSFHRILIAIHHLCRIQANGISNDEVFLGYEK